MAKTACSYISQFLTFCIGETLPAANLLLLNLCRWTVVCSLATNRDIQLVLPVLPTPCYTLLRDLDF